MQGRHLPPFPNQILFIMEENKKPKIATGGISDEMRKMDVGDVVLFPLEKYNYNSVRATPATLMQERVIEGKRWKTGVNYEKKSVEVTRIA